MSDALKSSVPVLTMGGDPVLVRTMLRSDEAAMLDFARRVNVHDLLFLARDIREPRVVAAWLVEIERGAMTSLVATLQDGHILGCTALLRDEWSWSRHVGEIRLLVSAEARGSGLGRLLAERCVASARERGLAKLFVRMTPDQGAALAVFEEMGFLPEALLRNHVRDAAGNPHDIAIMALDVARQNAAWAAYGVSDMPQDSA